MKNKFILFCVLAVFGIACQKELTDEGVPEFWALTKVAISDLETKALLQVYDYEFDSTTRRPTKLGYLNVAQGVTRTIYPSFSSDTVFMGANSFVVLDASKRIKQLSESNARPGVANGDYYYSYDGEGHLEERLYDDQFSDAIRTTFSYDNGDLVQYSQDFKGYPLANRALLTYRNNPRILAFGQYSLLEIFPELLMYMPCLNIGRAVLYPLEKINSEVSIPAPPTPPYTTFYSNFEMNDVGCITGFDTEVKIGTNAPVRRHYEFSYRLFN